ncbi:hypothetical protein VUR80DRAFT_3368 [Thermomyces stellatus]
MVTGETQTHLEPRPSAFPRVLTRRDIVAISAAAFPLIGSLLQSGGPYRKRQGLPECTPYAAKFTTIRPLESGEPGQGGAFTIHKYKDGGCGWWVLLDIPQRVKEPAVPALCHDACDAPSGDAVYRRSRPRLFQRRGAVPPHRAASHSHAVQHGWELTQFLFKPPATHVCVHRSPLPYLDSHWVCRGAELGLAGQLGLVSRRSGDLCAADLSPFSFVLHNTLSLVRER